MRQKSVPVRAPAEQFVKDIRRATSTSDTAPRQPHQVHGDAFSVTPPHCPTTLSDMSFESSLQ
jgi:hypothetical protein